MQCKVCAIYTIIRPNQDAVQIVEHGVQSSCINFSSLPLNAVITFGHYSEDGPAKVVLKKQCIVCFDSTSNIRILLQGIAALPNILQRHIEFEFNGC